MPREERLVIKKGAPPTKLLLEVKPAKPERKKVSDIERALTKFTKFNVPGFMKNVMTLAVGGVTLYIMFSSLSVMMPYATQVYVQFGKFLGFMVPFMMVYMMFSIVIGFVKLMVF